MKTKNVSGVLFIDYPKMTKDDWVVSWQDALKTMSAPVDPNLSGFDLFLDIENRSSALASVANAFACTHDPNQTDWSTSLSEIFLPAAADCEKKFYQDEDLFARCKKAYAESEAWPENDQKLARDALHEFHLAGCGLPPPKKFRLLEITERLAKLKVDFQALLSKANAETIVFDEKDIVGVSEDILDATRTESGKHAFTLIRSNVDLLMSLNNRETRRLTYKASQARNIETNSTSNIMKEMLALRNEMKDLLGYKTFAHMDLADKMAKDPSQVQNLLLGVWEGVRSKAEKEYEEVCAVARDNGVDKIEPWDREYYINKTKQKNAQVDKNIFSPYLTFRKVEALAFSAARDLLGVEFTPCSDIPLYHPSAEGYLVKKNGEVIGGLIMDYQKRLEKGPGAWMNSMVEQSTLYGTKPVAINVSSFYDGTNKDASIVLGDATTVFHELGHALHGLLSNVKYASQSGTRVARDFVELPSQLFENWLMSEEGLNRAGFPSELAQKALAMENWGLALQKAQYLVSALFDLNLHTGEVSSDASPSEWRSEILSKINAPDWIEPWHEIERFSHIWDGGYEASYYSYLWAEVIEADMFSLFKNNLFDEVGSQVLSRLYSAGGAQDEEKLFEELMGRPQNSRPFMERMGLVIPEKKITM